MKLRTIVVDDEPLARSRIAKLLKDYDDIHLIGQCNNGKEAVELINKKRPDLIFLDIQMPDFDGFKVVSQLDLSHQPMIVFATAYDKYALKAFDVHAIAYLLNPFDKDRFGGASDRAKEQIKLKKSSDFNRKLLSLLNDYQQEKSNYTTSFCLKEGGRLITIQVDEVYWLETDGNYLVLNLENRDFLYRGTMNTIEAELDPEQFLRIHRSFLVNLVYVKKVRYLNNSEYEFQLKNDKKLISSRSYKDKIVSDLADRNLI